ncbi:MAG: hypothetical protein H6Q29_421 [Bacteroidetes bacterium]|nr:hypothetical protein [Bacteroidota bacterium]
MGRGGIDHRFLRRVAAVLLVAATLLAYPLLRYASPAVTVGVVAGAAMSTLNVLLGFIAIEYAFGKSYTTFLKVVIGGMGVRMLGMLGMMLVLILVFRVQALPLTLSMLVFYLVYLVLEILFIQTKVVVKSQD